MLTVLSPAKKLDFDTDPPEIRAGSPRFLAEAETLVRRLREMDSLELADLMGISLKLADLNVERFQQWTPEHHPGNSRPALFAFAGDVYQGLDAASLSAPAIAFAEEHLRILSGLYGLLRPLDLIQPYRLEMGTRLKVNGARDLYAFWGDAITDALAEELKGHAHPVLVNLASQEYFKAIRPRRLGFRIVTPVFKERRGDRFRIISFNAKRARGMMARFILDRGIDEPEALIEFDRGGYRFHPELSEGDTWVFTRD